VGGFGDVVRWTNSNRGLIVEGTTTMALRKKKTLLDQAHDYVDAVRPHVESAVVTTKEAIEGFVETTALPAWEDAKEKAGPAVKDARAKAAPLVADARAKAAPVVADVAARAQEAAAQAKEAADARVATLRGEEPEKKGGKLKKFFLFAAVAGAVGFVAKKLQGGQQTDNWQSSYVPKPAPSSPAPAPVDDVGGSAPDEAIADAADEPQPVSTPEDPAEVVDIAESSEAPAPKKAAKKS
jgi:vacuolar-type H+-ATPase subunit H